MTPLQQYRHAVKMGWIGTRPQEVNVQVIIEHPKSGATYEIALGDFRRGKHYQAAPGAEPQTFEDAGFKIVSTATGEPYVPPTPRGQGEHAV